MGTVVVAYALVWLKRILKDLEVSINDPILLYWDNLNNMHLARNPDFHPPTKHIDVHYHIIQECFLVGDVHL